MSIRGLLVFLVCFAALFLVLLYAIAKSDEAAQRKCENRGGQYFHGDCFRGNVVIMR